MIMEAQPFIVVDRCKEKIEFYRDVLGGEITILRKQGDDVFNADLHVDGCTLKFADTKAARPAQQGDYVRVFLKLAAEDGFRSVYGRFADGGRVLTEPYEAPFNGLLAIVADRNGVCWVLPYYRE
ncbi:VOC family protein [Paenibacillus sp. GCM10023250]|uniref:VOC family protein n=1 Tax=Paenibacillus sp. GCM10023250 TaxID=3252648 RepID=UPI0036141416